MSANRHEPAVQRGLAPRSGPVAGVNGTNVPRHSDPIHDHWDEAWRLGYAAARRDAVEAVKALHDDANAKRIISGKREPDDDYYWALDDSVAAIEELGGNNGH